MRLPALIPNPTNSECRYLLTAGLQSGTKVSVNNPIVAPTHTSTAEPGADRAHKSVDHEDDEGLARLSNE